MGFMGLCWVPLRCARDLPCCDGNQAIALCGGHPTPGGRLCQDSTVKPLPCASARLSKHGDPHLTVVFLVSSDDGFCGQKCNGTWLCSDWKDGLDHACGSSSCSYGGRGNISLLWEISSFKCVRNFPLNSQATVRNKPGAKFSPWGAFSLPLCSLAFDLLSVGRGWRRPLKSGLPPWLEGAYTPTVHADVPGRGKGSGESRTRVRDQGIPVNEGIGVCCAPKQIKGLVLDCLGPWGMGLRSR